MIMPGPIRSGKSFSADYNWIYFLTDVAVPKVKCLITGKTGDSAKSNVIDEILRKADEEGILSNFEYKKAPSRLIYRPKGIECRVVGAYDEGAEGRIRGATYQGWYGDEVTLYPLSFIKHAIGRTSHKPMFKLLTCNPDSPSHYVKTNIIDKIDAGEIAGNVVYFGLDDNPALTEDYKDLIKKSFSGHFYDRYIKGLWVGAEGVVFGNFDRSFHLVDDYPRGHITEYILGIDWGYTNPLAMVLIGVDYDNNYWLIDEFYETQQNIDESLHYALQAKGWYSILNEAGYAETIQYAYADSNRPEFISLFYQHTGISCFPAPKGPHSVVEGIQIMQQYLSREPKSPKLRVVKKCQNWIKEVEAYCWNEKKDEPIKEHDHLMDATRYAIYTRERSRGKLLDFNRLH
jgi:PBSX family phage terminase large subunit